MYILSKEAAYFPRDLASNFDALELNITSKYYNEKQSKI